MNTIAGRLAEGIRWSRRATALTCALLGATGLSMIAQGGINGGGKARGVITESGVMRIGDVSYDLGSALVMVDGEPAASSTLDVGSLVTVDAVVDADGATGIATRVSYTSDLRGPVTSLAADGESFELLGQTVRVDTHTILEADGPGSDPAATLMVGSVVEVSGYRDASGQLLATRVERQGTINANAEVRVVGYVSRLDPYSLRFAINGLRVNYSGVVMLNESFGNGALVEVRGTRTSAGQMNARLVVPQDPSLGGVEYQSASLQGLVTTVLSGSTFSVGGQTIVLRSITRYVGGTKAVLQSGTPVRIEGRFDGAGRVIAQSVTFGFE